MMEISLRRSKNLLNVLFDDDELVEKHLEGGLFRRRYECPQGVTLTFEKSEKGFFLYVSFDRYKDPEVLSQIANGQSVEEFQVLWELAHLPCAKMFGSNVLLPDGCSVELIDTVKFELRKVMDGLWASGESESEVDRRNRQMRLNRVRDGVPRIFRERVPGVNVTSQAESARGEVIFTNKGTETESAIQRNRMDQAGKDPASERALETKEQQETAPERRFEPEKPAADLPPKAEPQVDAPGVPEKRDPDEIAECDRCERLFYEDELTEVRLGLFLCKYCRTDPVAVMELGLTSNELVGIDSNKCDDCGHIWHTTDLTTERGRQVCPACMSVQGRTYRFSPDVKQFPVGTRWTRLPAHFFPRGLSWFHRCVVGYNRLENKGTPCNKLFWGRGKYCKKHHRMVREGYSRMGRARLESREAWCARLVYAFCKGTFIWARDSFRTLYFVDTNLWPEWHRFPDGTDKEPGATEKYMLPIAKEKWAKLDWTWIRYFDMLYAGKEE
jgi:formylmethanofuran dehydrogenase subunit E